MDFDDISRVVPWIETAAQRWGSTSRRRSAPSRAASRATWATIAIPKGARYVVSLRDPKDALRLDVPLHGRLVLRAGRDLDRGFRRVARGRDDRRDYWNHLVSWWNVRDNPNVLCLPYEGMTADPAGTSAAWPPSAALPLDDDLLALTLERQLAGLHAGATRTASTTP